MRSPRSRLLTIPLVWLPALTALWLYAATRDWSHTWRQLQMGHPVAGPAHSPVLTRAPFRTPSASLRSRSRR